MGAYHNHCCLIAWSLKFSSSRTIISETCSLLGWGIYGSSSFFFYDLITSMVKLQAILLQRMTFPVNKLWISPTTISQVFCHLTTFKKWNAMKDFGGRKSSYLSTLINVTTSTTTFQATYQTKATFKAVCSVTIANKGRDMEYGKILEVFTVIDLSSNRFQGDIPECLGNLRGLQVLNLSNNMLDGSIPSSLSNITQLESLDLSLNKLSGEIPQQLVQLTFLAFFNVSFNRLRGLVPQGSQFSTFDSSSLREMRDYGACQASVILPEHHLQPQVLMKRTIKIQCLGSSPIG
ncbi:hypothetical protein TIFTF001_029546 [Ficus carica]|uniref:Uncharacterized protein n=1 Tax=Ficus carica TaxID=3494 RepID=A0AA88DRX3_FICCA|nr:hypothetical protein TIFTF001_029546 [Ficus carica]